MLNDWGVGTHKSDGKASYTEVFLVQSSIRNSGLSIS